MSPLAADSIPLPDKPFPSAAPVGRSARRGDTTPNGDTDPELVALVAAWPTLPDPINAAIRALVGIAAGPSGHRFIPAPHRERLGYQPDLPSEPRKRLLRRAARDPEGGFTRGRVVLC